MHVPFSRYLYTIDNYDLNLSTQNQKTVSTNDIVVKSGTNLLLEATASITLQSGFKAKYGCVFKARVDGTNPYTRSDKNPNSCGSLILAKNDLG
jgi:hypothetical protein